MNFTFSISDIAAFLVPTISVTWYLGRILYKILDELKALRAHGEKSDDRIERLETRVTTLEQNK